MSNPVFPTLAMGQDSKYYAIGQEDVAMKTKMDGGYVVSRAKHTRIPRLTFKTGFTAIGEADRALLTAFYNTVRGGSVIFDWTDPVQNTVYQVRFGGEIEYKYTGVGGVRLWDVTINLEQA